MLGPAALVGDGDSSAQSKSMATLRGDGRSEYAAAASKIPSLVSPTSLVVPDPTVASSTLGRNAVVLAHAL